MTVIVLLFDFFMKFNKIKKNAFKKYEIFGDI